MKNSHFLKTAALLALAAGCLFTAPARAAAPVGFGGLTFIPFGSAAVSVTNLLAGGSLPGAPAHEAVALTGLNLGSSNGVIIRMPGVSEFGAEMTPLALPVGSVFRLGLRGTNGQVLGVVTFTGPSGTASPAIGFDPDFSAVGAVSRTVELHCRDCDTPAYPITVPGASGGGLTVAPTMGVPVQITGFSARMTRATGASKIIMSIGLRDEGDVVYAANNPPIRECLDDLSLQIPVVDGLPALGEVELTVVAIGTPRILFPGFKVGDGVLRSGPSSVVPGGLRLAWEGTGLLESSINVTGPWSPLSSPPGSFDMAVAAPRLFLQVRELLPDVCRHDLALNNTTASPLLRRVRVVAGNAGTRLVMATPAPGWAQILATPTNITWMPIGGGTIPAGAPLPGSFAIWVQANPAPDKHVLLEWLDAATNVLCRQKLAVPCAAGQEPYQPVDPPAGPPISSVPCDCVSGVVVADPDSLEQADPDYEAEIGTPVQLSRTRFKFPNLSTVEPAGIRLHSTWTVTRRNNLQEDEVLAVPFTLDASGNPTYDFPGPGLYTIYLRCEGTNCLGNDFDVAWKTVTVSDLRADLMWAQQYCDPLRINFTDVSVSDAGIMAWEWKVYSNNGNTLLATYTSQNCSHLFAQYPTAAQQSRVSLTVTDASGNTAQTNLDFYFDNACRAEFDWSYSACGNTLPVRVQFLNKSAGQCPTALWNFGDGGTSTQFGPSHDFATWGQHTVSLTMTDNNGQSCFTTQIINLQPNSVKLDYERCPDGYVYYETDAANPQWSFASGSPSTSTNGSQRVHYGAPGNYQVILVTSNSNHAVCRQTNVVQVASVTCCVRNDRKNDVFDFSTGGRDYRLQSKFIQVNALGLHYLRGKTKLKKKSPNGVYRAAKADAISVEWTGDVYLASASGHCDCVTPWHEDALKLVANRNKAKEIEYVGGGFPGSKFRTHVSSLNSTHKVTVNGVTQIRTLTLGHDCPQ